jgi:hypothetical protein
MPEHFDTFSRSSLVMCVAMYFVFAWCSKLFLSTWSQIIVVWDAIMFKTVKYLPHRIHSDICIHSIQAIYVYTQCVLMYFVFAWCSKKNIWTWSQGLVVWDAIKFTTTNYLPHRIHSVFCAHIIQQPEHLNTFLRSSIIICVAIYFEFAWLSTWLLSTWSQSLVVWDEMLFTTAKYLPHRIHSLFCEHIIQIPEHFENVLESSVTLCVAMYFTFAWFSKCLPATFL